MNYTFQNAEKTDADQVFALIESRIRWMDETGIEQWNKEDYWTIFPKEYYLKAIDEKRLFILKDETGRTVCTGVLTFDDWCWEPDGISAAYLHNFAGAGDVKGAGSIYLEQLESYLRASGRKVLRLDCSESSEKLNRYYEERGYRAAGHVSIGIYYGIKRQKFLQDAASPSEK